MPEISRRQFMLLSAKLAALLGVSATALPAVARAVQTLASGQAPLLWLQGQSCSGCSVSLLNAVHPDPVALLTRYVSMQFHGTLSTATGELGMTVLNDNIRRGGYLLAVEGAVPAAMPEACVIGGEPFAKQLLRAAAAADAIVTVGACACYGGIPAAENNPTGSQSAREYLQANNIAKPLIAIPGCPVHPDWLVGTLVQVLAFGVPELNADGAPRMFFDRLVHDQCPRFADYERENFAEHFSDRGCLFKLGFLGPVTHADCPTRLWNAGTNFCINAGAPCIGCSSKEFSRSKTLPFYRKSEQAQIKADKA